MKLACSTCKHPCEVHEPYGTSNCCDAKAFLVCEDCGVLLISLDHIMCDRTKEYRCFSHWKKHAWEVENGFVAFNP